VPRIIAAIPWDARTATRAATNCSDAKCYQRDKRAHHRGAAAVVFGDGGFGTVMAAEPYMASATPILVVEDNAVNRLAMQALLGSLELPSHLVDSGLHAITAFRAGDYALVLMDLMMPGMDGFETARAIRALEFATGRRTPILAVTALDRDAARGRCVDAGIDDIICKPIDADVIAKQLRRWTNIAVADQNGISPSLDANVLRRIEGSEEIGRMLKAFLVVTSALLGELEVAIAAEDDANVSRALHELKGASLQMREREMARLCFELELANRDDNRTEMVALYASLAHAFVRIKRVAERRTAAVEAHP
jgi:CheY-like chemotaxis protein